MSDLRVDDALDLVRVTMTHTDIAHLKAHTHIIDSPSFIIRRVYNANFGG
jgi:hypothetical protein